MKWEGINLGDTLTISQLICENTRKRKTFVLYM